MRSQDDSINSSENKNSYFLFNPPAFLDPYAPRWQAGYIQHINSHLKLGSYFGYGGKNINFNFSEKQRTAYRLWEIRPEVFLILNPKVRTVKYLSIEFFYIDQFNTFSDEGYESSTGTDYTYAQADFNRQKYGLHLKYGLFLNTGKHFGLNFSGGFGFRVLNQEYNNIINQVRKERALFAGIGDPYYKEVFDTRFHPALSFKLYYRL
ncbi:hypothetical protein [Maribacter sp. 2308TA10-17]|uniref:hypothetical protein n=1 Tax=Maribacter sp. 2308TA10-17 TaxID=3386276 RepID=UPI0039BD5462